METRKVAYAVILAALVVALSPLFFPVAGAKVLPWQHMVNVLAAVLLGPWYAVGIALVASIVRNALGLGTLFAFPGSMIGAFLAGYTYKLTRNIYLAALGEIIGTGILGAVTSTLIVAPMFMNRPMEAAALIIPFLASCIPGSILGVIGLVILERAGVGQRLIYGR